MGDLLVSVLLPSRHRSGLLGKAIASLGATAARPGQVEVLVATDPDDAETQGFTLDWLLDVGVLTAPQRWGRGSLHEYYNWLARHAAGEWLLIFNDDATMETPGWDEIIAAQEHCIAAIGSNHGDHMFIAVPAAWIAAAGYMATTPDIDNFLFDAGTALGRLHRPPVRIYHDPFYVTGNNGDETYWEGRADAQRVNEAGWGQFGDREQAIAQMAAAIQGLG